MAMDDTELRQELLDTWRDRETVTVRQAALILGVTVPFLYEQVREGELGAFQVGQKWLVPVSRLRALLDIPSEP